jgi:hypothetical protein
LVHDYPPLCSLAGTDCSHVTLVSSQDRQAQNNLLQ